MMKLMGARSEVCWYLRRARAGRDVTIWRFQPKTLRRTPIIMEIKNNYSHRQSLRGEMTLRIRFSRQPKHPTRLATSNAIKDHKIKPIPHHQSSQGQVRSQRSPAAEPKQSSEVQAQSHSQLEASTRKALALRLSKHVENIHSAMKLQHYPRQPITADMSNPTRWHRQPTIVS